MTRWKHALAPLALAAILVLGVSPAPTSAQEAPPAEGAAPGEGSGRPLDGYFGTGILAFLALFIVAKSARR